MHSLERHDPLRRGVPHDPVHRRRAARAPDRPDGVVRADPRAAAAAGVGGRGAADRMPEGHTLHRLATSLDRRVRRRRPVRVGSPQGRFAESAALVDGRVLDRRRGPTASTCSSTSTCEQDSSTSTSASTAASTCTHSRGARRPGGGAATPSARCGSRLVGAAAYADLRGATACELVTPERARRAAGAARAGPAAARRRPRPRRGSGSGAAGRPIGGLLMDQSVVAGIGNVYRAELLYRHRVDPFRPGRTLRASQWREMWDDLVALMADGVRTGRIDTVRPEHLTDGRARRPGPAPRPHLRLPAGRRAVPGLRHPGADQGAPDAQPLLVRPVPASVPALHGPTHCALE